MTEATRKRLLVAAVLVLAGGVYANTLSYGAAWDDTRFVFQSGATGGITALKELVASPFLTDVPPGRSPYRPVTAVSYALDWTLGGGQASFFHWTNVLLHVLVTGLVLALLGAFGLPLAAAVAGGAVFAVHPVHVEAVANLAGRAELLAALFVLAAVVVYARRPRSCLGHLAVLVLFALGLGAKENAAVLPGLLVGVALFVTDARGRSPARRLLDGWFLWVGCAAVFAAYLLVRLEVLGTLTTYDVAPFILDLPATTRITTAVANWAEYARLLFFPADLVVDYGPAVVLPATFSDLRFWWGAALGLLALAVAVRARRRRPSLTLGVWWFAVAVLPVSNVLVPIAQWLAERFLYLPSVGLSLAAGGVAVLATRRLDADGLRGAALVGAVALFALSARTWTRNTTWESTETVARTLIEEHPEAFRAQWLLGRALLESGRAEEGFGALDRAVSLSPNAIELRLERGTWLLRTGRPSRARAAMDSLPPGRHPGRAMILARSLAVLGEVEAADSVLSAARERFPDNAELAALGDSLLSAGGGR